MDSATRRVVETLRASIRALGKTNGQVERALGSSAGYLSRLFAGRIDLKLEHIEEIARVLEVEPEELLYLAFSDVGEKQQLSSNARRLREVLRGPELPTSEELAARGASAETGPGSMEDLMLRTLQRIIAPPARPQWPPLTEEEVDQMVLRSLRKLFLRQA